MILVTGATGNVGGQVVDQLLEAGADVRTGDGHGGSSTGTPARTFGEAADHAGGFR